VTVEFLKSAASAADFPHDAVPQLAFVGRSNVGKSSLINALTRTKVARTSAAPGKTRLLNLYLVRRSGPSPERLYLVDLPGYGYARGGVSSASAFDALVSDYFAHPAPGRAAGPRRPAATPHGPSAALLVVDARHPGLPTDVAALGWLQAQRRPVGVVVSKIDKLSRAERTRALNAWAMALNVPILPISAATGEGLEELWKRISKLLNAPNEPNVPTVPNAASGQTAPSAPNVPPRAAGTATTSRSSISRRSRT
jgi:GTP-binding protein